MMTEHVSTPAHNLDGAKVASMTEHSSGSGLANVRVKIDEVRKADINLVENNSKILKLWTFW